MLVRERSVSSSYGSISSYDGLAQGCEHNGNGLALLAMNLLQDVRRTQRGEEEEEEKLASFSYVCCSKEAREGQNRGTLRQTPSRSSSL